MAAPIELQSTGVRAGQPEALFRMPSTAYFRPSRDGKRFLVPQPEGGVQPERSMVVRLNWAAPLKGVRHLFGLF